MAAGLRAMTGDEATAGRRYHDRYFVVRDGLKLHYRDYPGSDDRTPIVCLHGLTRNARDFADFAERCSPRFRVLALDFRGRGESAFDPLPMRYNPLTYAADVIELLDRLGIDQAIFVGTSLGGLVTMTIAAMSPQRIAAAILNDIGPELNPVGIERIQSYVGKDPRFASWDDAAAALASNQGAAFPNYGPDEWLAMARRTCREENGEVRFDYDMAIVVPFERSPAPTIDLWPLFKALGQKPLLVVRGAISELLSASSLEAMHVAVPDLQSVTVPDVGHAPMLDEPEALAAIDRFLDFAAC
jgi:pimeloyl-ACP methyl ester carboxylesterase